MWKWTILAALLGTTLILANTPAPSGGGGGSITLVQAAIGSNAGCTPTCSTAAFGSNTTAGDSILVCVVGHQATGSTNTLASVSGQGTFTVLASSVVNYGATEAYTNIWAQCALATGITGGATTAETCHVTTNSGGACVAYEVTAGESTILYSTGTCSTGCNLGYAATAGFVTTTSNNSFGVTMFVQDDGAGAGAYFGTPGPGWTQSLNVGGGSYEGGSEYQNQSSLGVIAGNSNAGRVGVVAATMVVLEP